MLFGCQRRRCRLCVLLYYFLVHFFFASSVEPLLIRLIRLYRSYRAGTLAIRLIRLYRSIRRNSGFAIQYVHTSRDCNMYMLYDNKTKHRKIFRLKCHKTIPSDKLFLIRLPIGSTILVLGTVIASHLLYW